MRQHVKHLLIGFDHHFGNSRTDGLKEYQAYGKALGIEVTQAKPFWFAEALNGKKITVAPEISKCSVTEPDKVTVSSSLIRRLLLAGNIEEANVALGHPYSLTGTVVGGHHIGTSIGYPTANIEPLFTGKLVPAIGVYAVWVNEEGHWYKGMLNIGRRPTLQVDSTIVIEVHLLDFTGNLYGKVLTLKFMKRLRKEIHFPDVEALVAQMHADKSQVETYLQQPLIS